MSQQPSSVVVVQQRVPSNGLGIAGFILSLLGLLGTCGLLSPLGLLLSFIALFKRPRGFAIAGLIIGLLGSIWAIILFFVIGLGAVLAMLGIGVAVQHVQAMHEINVLGDTVTAKVAAGEPVPSDLTGLTSASIRTTDPWGHSYRLIKKDDGTFDITSDGPDGKPATSDDLSWIDFRDAGADFNEKPTPQPD